MKRLARTVLLLCLVATAAIATPLEDAKREILQAYRRASEGAKYKSVDTLMSIRCPGYEILAQDGSRVSTSNDRARLQNLFYNATRVRMDFQIGKVEPIKVKLPGSESEVTALAAECFQSFGVESVNLATGKLSTQNLQTKVVDLWVPTTLGWRIYKCRVVKQTENDKAFRPYKDLPAW